MYCYLLNEACIATYSTNQLPTYFFLAPTTYLHTTYHTFDFPPATCFFPSVCTAHPLLHHLFAILWKKKTTTTTNVHNTSYLRINAHTYILACSTACYISFLSKMPKQTWWNKYVENATKIASFPPDMRLAPSLARTFSKGPKTGWEGTLAHLQVRCPLGVIWDGRMSNGIASRPFG